MTSAARIRSDVEELDLPHDRAGLVRHLNRLAADVGADSYMLLDLVPENGEAGIIASNWVFDTVRAVGVDLLRRIVQAPRTTFLGQPPRLWHPMHEAIGKSFLTKAEAAALQAGWHAEIASVRIRAGRVCYATIFSAALPRSIDEAMLPPACLSLSYALSALAGASPQPAAASSVSDRERECLRWVSEGKTAEEIATIVGVTANTVNSYVGQAIRKLSARNRAMAIATAIRGGLI